MDLLALLLAIAAAVAGFLASDRVDGGRRRLATVGVAVALLSLALICQFVDLTGTHVLVSHH